MCALISVENEPTRCSIITDFEAKKNKKKTCIVIFRNVRNDRATPAEIASYYQHYVSQMSLEQNFACGTTVTSVTRQAGSPDGSPPCWRVTGLQRREGEVLAGTF